MAVVNVRRAKTIGALVAIALLGLLAVTLKMAMGGPSTTIQAQHALSGDPGAPDYVLTGELAGSAAGKILVSSGAVIDDKAYLVYLRSPSADPVGEKQPLRFSVGVRGVEHVAAGVELVDFDGLEVGLVEVPLLAGPAEYRLSADGRASEGNVVLRRVTNGPAGGTSLMNTGKMTNGFEYRTQIAERGVIGPDIFAVSLDVVDSAGQRRGTAISISEQGVVARISDGELAELIKAYSR